MLLANAVDTHSHTEILCTILLIATIVLFIVGIVEALGLTRFTAAYNRFSTLIAAVILLVVYLFVC